ncbi:4-hydroxyacetophenone monooxygenase [Anopheles sinensis]|uniref:4-hydroxyacetophenone monooxygenase n=1 Tax=Anopheles sinensis TaxID=74873 RepID=A0A084WKT5_ANOSI|nr:4-hydroxyacetophenone monooxygenase [Anopheles sinensis]
MISTTPSDPDPTRCGGRSRPGGPAPRMTDINGYLFAITRRGHHNYPCGGASFCIKKVSAGRGRWQMQRPSGADVCIRRSRRLILTFVWSVQGVSLTLPCLEEV